MNLQTSQSSNPNNGNRASTFSMWGLNLLLSADDLGVWRLTCSDAGEPNTAGAAQILAAELGENEPYIPADITKSSEENSVVYIAPDGSKAVVNDIIGFYDASGRLRRKITKIEKTGKGISVTVPLEKSERIYGTGERFDRVNQRGKKVDIYALDRWSSTEGNSYAPVPFVISSDCTGMFLNSFARSEINIGRNSMVLTQTRADMDLFIFTGENPADILSAYSRLTGFAPMPPEWAFGTVVCRYRPDFKTPQGIYSMMKAMEENDFPWNAVIAESWETYDPDRWRELHTVSERLHSAGKKLMLYDRCGKFPYKSPEKCGIDDSCAVLSGDGVWLRQTASINIVDNLRRKRMRCIDVTNPAAVEKWNNLWERIITEVGVDGAKIDFCELFPDSEDIRFADGRNPAGAHHWYPVRYNLMQRKSFEQCENGGLNISRGGGIGIQRYPFIWAGDQRREFYFLGAVIKAALSAGLSGIPFVTWDMAGYRPAWRIYDKRHENEVFIRGLEFTAFSPMIQTHGSVKRPYDFDDRTKAVYHAYSNIHECLKPYLLEQARYATETGVPVMRHLFLYDKCDERALDTEDEYMLGGGLLVAPVLSRRAKRSIYLPKGTWVNIFTGKEHKGGTMLENIGIPLESIAVFRLEEFESSALDEALEAAEKYIDEINSLIR